MNSCPWKTNLFVICIPLATILLTNLNWLELRGQAPELGLLWIWGLSRIIISVLTIPSNSLSSSKSWLANSSNSDRWFLIDRIVFHFLFRVQLSISCPIIHCLSDYPLRVGLSVLCPYIHFVPHFPFHLPLSISCPIIHFVFDYPFVIQLSISCPIIHSCPGIHFMFHYIFHVQFSFSNDSLKFLIDSFIHCFFSFYSFTILSNLFYSIPNWFICLSRTLS